MRFASRLQEETHLALVGSFGLFFVLPFALWLATCLTTPSFFHLLCPLLLSLLPQELDVKAGGGQTLRMGDMLRHFLTKLEWFATLFPRIPVPIQKEIERRLALHPPMAPAGAQVAPEGDEGAPEAPAEELAGPEARRRR